MTICACLIAACLPVWALVWVWQATINPPAKHREPYPRGHGGHDWAAWEPRSIAVFR